MASLPRPQKSPSAMRLKGSQRGTRVRWSPAGGWTPSPLRSVGSQDSEAHQSSDPGEGDHLLLAVEGRARGRRHRGDERRGAREREGSDDLLHRSGSARGRAGYSLVRRRAASLWVAASLSLGAARARSATAAAAACVLVSAQPQRLCWAPGDGDGRGGRSQVRSPTAAGRRSVVAGLGGVAAGELESMPGQRARYLSDSQPIDIARPISPVSGPLAALVGSVDERTVGR